MIETDAVALSCQELVELVTDYLEDALAPGDLSRFEQHLAGCGKCRQYLEQLRQTLRVMGTLSQRDLSPEVEKALFGAFRGWARG